MLYQFMFVSCHLNPCFQARTFTKVPASLTSWDCQWDNNIKFLYVLICPVVLMREEKGQKQNTEKRVTVKLQTDYRLFFKGKKNQNKIVSQNGNKFNLKSDLREIYIYAFVRAEMLHSSRDAFTVRCVKECALKRVQTEDKQQPFFRARHIRYLRTVLRFSSSSTTSRLLSVGSLLP